PGVWPSRGARRGCHAERVAPGSFAAPAFWLPPPPRGEGEESNGLRVAHTPGGFVLTCRGPLGTSQPSVGAEVRCDAGGRLPRPCRRGGSPPPPPSTSPSRHHPFPGPTPHHAASLPP